MEYYDKKDKNLAKTQQSSHCLNEEYVSKTTAKSQI